MTKTVERIEREIGIPGLAALLADRLAPTDLQSLLLEVYRLQAQRRQPAAVLRDYENNRFVHPSSASPERLAEWERTAFTQLPEGFETVTLAPVTPLGTCSAVGLVDQNRVVSTIRNTEVVSDSTNVLALECALRRRALLRQNPKSPTAVHLAASHRLLRAQFFNQPSAVPHFSAFGLCSAGRDQGNLQFELTALVQHIGFSLQALRVFLGSGVVMRLAVTDFSASDRHALIATRLFAPVQAQFPDVECLIDSQREGGRDYYVDLCFHIDAAVSSGRLLQLVDGGVVNWTQKLLSSAKERCVISGVGSERICTEFAH